MFFYVTNLSYNVTFGNLCYHIEKICGMGGCLGECLGENVWGEMSSGKCHGGKCFGWEGNAGGKCRGKLLGGGGGGGLERNVGIPKSHSHLFERHKQLMFVIQSSGCLNFQQIFNQTSIMICDRQVDCSNLSRRTMFYTVNCIAIFSNITLL